jgi:hypothetical protein
MEFFQQNKTIHLWQCKWPTEKNVILKLESVYYIFSPTDWQTHSSLESLQLTAEISGFDVLNVFTIKFL